MADYSGRLLLEACQREALIILFNGLNDKIDSMSVTWQNEDEDLWYALSRGNPDWTVENIEEDNFYPGMVPSLINAPIEKYPNVCVVCYRGDPKGSSDDEGENYTHRLIVEIMVRSGPFDETVNMSQIVQAEQETNSRIHKTVDAAHLTLLDNKTLNNSIPELPAPTVSIGDLFIRRKQDGEGARFYWQGGSLEYGLDKYVNVL